MGVESILLLIAGSIAVVAAVTVALFRGAFGRFRFTRMATTDSQIAQTVANQSETTQPAIVEQNTTVAEAPAPFPEDSVAKTSVPTDVSAISAITSVAPVLVIPTPKRARASRRLPSTATAGTSTRKRRSAKAKTAVPEISASSVSTDMQPPTGSPTEGINSNVN